MKVYRKDDKIIFEVDYWSKRSNPYMPNDEDVGKHKTLIGIICNDEHGNEERGFAKVIDMDYKDKVDQNTDIMIHCWGGNKKEFIELCKKLEIEVYEYPICAYCKKTIFGSFGIDSNGKNICFDCEEKLKNKDEPKFNKMQTIKNNPPLSLSAIGDKIKSPHITLIVSPYLQKIAAELSNHFIQNVFKFEKNGKELTIKEAIEENLFEFNIIVEEKMEDNEWILITKDNKYYSKGDNSN